MKNPILFTAAIAAISLASIGSASAATLTLNSTADTYLRGGSADQNYGGSTEILFGNHATVGPFTGLLRFDLTNPLLTGATINSVTLTLTSTANGAGTSVTLTVFQLAAANANWVEGTLNGGTPVPATPSATWSNKSFGSTSVPWAGSVGARTAGTDYVNTSLASFNGNASTFGTGSLGFTSTGAFTATTQTFIGSSLNLWVGTPSGAAVSDFFRIASNGSPQLTIDYTAVPEPSTYVIMLVGIGALILFRRCRRA